MNDLPELPTWTREETVEMILDACLTLGKTAQELGEQCEHEDDVEYDNLLSSATDLANELQRLVSNAHFSEPGLGDKVLAKLLS